jgi:hypothetical protein
LCDRIARTKIKGEGPRKPNNPETEPTLSLYPPMLSSGRTAKAGGSRGEGSEQREYELCTARANARRDAPLEGGSPAFPSSLGVAYSDLSQAMPMILQPHYSAQSQNELFRADLVGSGGAYPLHERDLYFQSLLNGPSLSAGAMGGSWMATGNPTGPSLPVSQTEASTVESLLQTMQLYLLQRRLQEQQIRALAPHALHNPYGVLLGYSATDSSEPFLRPTRTADTSSLQSFPLTSDSQERYIAQSATSGDGRVAAQGIDGTTPTSPKTDMLAAAALDAAARSPATSPKRPKTETYGPDL